MKKKWLGALSAVVLVFSPVVSSGLVYSAATTTSTPKQTEESKMTLLPVEGIHSILTLGESGKLVVGDRKDSQKSVSFSNQKKAKKEPNSYKFTSLSPEVISVDSKGNWKTLKSGKVTISIEKINTKVTTVASSKKISGGTEVTNNSETKISEEPKNKKNNAYARSIDVEVFASKEDITDVDISPNLSLSGISEEVIVGDKGVLKGEIGKVAGLSDLNGQFTYTVQNSSKLALDSSKKWEALKTGVTTVSLKYEYSEKSMTRFKEKYPNAKLVVKTDSITRIVTVKEKGSTGTTSSTSSSSSITSTSSSPTTSSSSSTSLGNSSNEVPPIEIKLIPELLGATSSLMQQSKGTFGLLLHTEDGLVKDLDVTADYNSNNQDILQVDKTGNYVALKPGNATLTINFTLTDKSIEKLKAAYNISNLATTSGVVTYEVTVVASTAKSGVPVAISSVSSTSSVVKKPLPQTGESSKSIIYSVVGIGIVVIAVGVLVKKKIGKR